MTYTVSSGTLNSTIPYHTIPYHTIPYHTIPYHLRNLEKSIRMIERLNFESVPKSTLSGSELHTLSTPSLKKAPVVPSPCIMLCYVFFSDCCFYCAFILFFTLVLFDCVGFTAITTLRASCSAEYCNRSCLFVGGWACYHDNSKLHASILTKLGLWKVVTISSWLNFGRPAHPGRGLRRDENFWLRLTTASAQCLSAFFILIVFSLKACLFICLVFNGTFSTIPCHRGEKYNIT